MAVVLKRRRVPSQIWAPVLPPRACATHDEILILRLAAHHGDTARCNGLTAATLAAYSSGAAVAEVPHLKLTDATETHLHLRGVTADKPGNAVAERTNPLDPWAAEAFRLYREEGFGGSDRSPFYSGYQTLDSDSARVTTSAHLKKLIHPTGLSTAGLTPEEIRVWSAIRTTHDTATFLDAATYHGTPWQVLHRRLR